MLYKKFHIIAYKAIKDSDITILNSPVPIIGVNESGKSSALEAMTHFDFRNDEIIAAKKWKFTNRYKPEVQEFSVSCDISLTQEELEQALEPHLLPVPEPKADSETDTATEDSPSIDSVATPPSNVETAAVATEEEVVEDELKSVTLADGKLTITRKFNSKTNKISYAIGDLESERIEKFARSIIQQLPRIYYFDNFLETPMPDVVNLSANYLNGTDNALSEDQKIVEGAFSSAGVDLRDYLNNKDTDAQDTLLSKVNVHVTKQIIEDWRKMHVPEGDVDLNKFNDVKIAFKLGSNRKSLEIKVIEQFPPRPDGTQPQITMKISERSQGFRWFFNFSARKCFAAVHEEQFLYLIDEPGSYLHNSAQTVLLDALIDLAKSHPVIFSTHSEFLLDPEKININDIKIVQKENYAISLIPLSNASSTRHEGALSTLYNALRTHIPIETVQNKKIIVTEGVTDFYFWKPLVDIVYLPGCGAGNNRYLLSIAIGASKKYIGLFDGDNAGDEARTHYEELFGKSESTNWISYTNKDNQPVKLEELLSSADATRLKTITSQTKLKRAITTLYFDNKFDEFWSGIDEQTKANVQTNITKFAEHLSITQTNIKHGFTV